VEAVREEGGRDGNEGLRSPPRASPSGPLVKTSLAFLFDGQCRFGIKYNKHKARRLSLSTLP